MNLLIPPLLEVVNSSMESFVGNVEDIDLSHNPVEYFDADLTLREINTASRAIEILSRLISGSPNVKVSQASLEYLNANGELVANKLVTSTVDDKGVTILSISQEGIGSTASGIFNWIINTLRRLYQLIVDFFAWLISKNVRYQYAIKNIQNKVALSRGVMLNLNNRVTVLSFAEFYMVEGIAKNIVTWCKSLDAYAMAQKIRGDVLIFKNGQLTEPDMPYLEAPLLAKGWTKVNAVTALKDALTLLRETDEPHALQRKVLGSIKELENTTFTVRDNRSLSDADRDAKITEIKAKVAYCQISVHAITKLEGFIRKLATTAIVVGNNLVPVGSPT